MLAVVMPLAQSAVAWGGVLCSECVCGGEAEVAKTRMHLVQRCMHMRCVGVRVCRPPVRCRQVWGGV